MGTFFPLGGYIPPHVHVWEEVTSLAWPYPSGCITTRDMTFFRQLATRQFATGLLTGLFLGLKFSKWREELLHRKTEKIFAQYVNI
jgi:hypothetical protein